MKYPRILTVFYLLAASGLCSAQTAQNQSAPPVSYSSISELNQLIANLQQASQQIQDDLSRLRIEKWKTDSSTKHQAQSDVESIQRNLQNALPGILNDLKNSPESTPLTFKLYRNLDALYDVLSSVAESTGAFGNREEFQTIDKDLGSIEDSRRAFADRMDKIATAKETEIGQLRTELQTAQAEISPKKVVVDDTAPSAKKKTTKKKPVSKPQTATPQNVPQQQTGASPKQ